MEDFINQKYLVYCANEQEAREFWDICQAHGLTMSPRGYFRNRLQKDLFDQSTWVAGWAGDDHNVVSYWWQERATGFGPLIAFEDFLKKTHLHIELSNDFLELI